LSTLLEHVGPSLECLALGTYINKRALLAGFAPLLSSPVCRLRYLDMGNALKLEDVAAAPGEGEGAGQAGVHSFHRFLHSLSANISLKEVKMGKGTTWGRGHAVLFAVALGTRPRALDSLNMVGFSHGPSGALRMLCNRCPTAEDVCATTPKPVASQCLPIELCCGHVLCVSAAAIASLLASTRPAVLDTDI
jgi:hypothetical protein